jgi:hypothetical protein
MRKIAMIFVLLALPVSAQEVPFHMPLPEGWKAETIVFPLEFAPQLEYEGLEELRFSPGMFDPEAADFFSYAFVWWVPAETVVSAQGLARDLETYFRGLARTVAESKGFDPENPSHSVEMRTISDQPKTFVGLVETFDAFSTRAPLYLMLRGQVIDCMAGGNTAVFFELSPQPESHEVWTTLSEIRDGFECSR